MGASSHVVMFQCAEPGPAGAACPVGAASVFSAAAVAGSIEMTASADALLQRVYQVRLCTALDARACHRAVRMMHPSANLMC